MNLAFKKTKKSKNHLNNLKPTFYLNVWRKIGNDISYYMIYILVGHAPFKISGATDAPPKHKQLLFMSMVSSARASTEWTRFIYNIRGTLRKTYAPGFPGG